MRGGSVLGMTAMVTIRDTSGLWVPEEEGPSQEEAKNFMLANVALPRATSCTSALPVPLFLWLRWPWQLFQPLLLRVT